VKYPGWNLQEYAVVTSTNLLAADLPLWTAVRADSQTMGRGRFQRTWVSDLGGLWLSAVVPCEGKATRATLPLAAGVAVCDVLKELGLPAVRMRWPNDVLVGDRKLAGLLIDQFVSGRAVVGIGLNVRNQPELHDPLLVNKTARLADFMFSPPELPVLTGLLLERLLQVVIELEEQGPSAVISRVNHLWGPRREVELDLDGKSRRGMFTGVDAQGRLAISDTGGEPFFYEAHEVRHLTET